MRHIGMSTYEVEHETDNLSTTIQGSGHNVACKEGKIRCSRSRNCCICNVLVFGEPPRVTCSDPPLRENTKDHRGAGIQIRQVHLI